MQVLKLRGCWRLGGSQAQAAITKLADSGKLEVLDVCDTNIKIDIHILRALSLCQDLRELSAPVLEYALALNRTWTLLLP